MICLTAGDGFAQTNLSLLDAYIAARDSDPSIAIARFRVDGADAQRDVARGRLFPQISIFGEWSENEIRYEQIGNIPLPDQAYPGERYGVQLRSPLFNIKSLRDFQRSGSLFHQSVEQLNEVESQLLSLLANAFLNVHLAEENLNQYGIELAALTEQLKQADALYERSLLPITQVLEAQTRADSLRAEMINAEGQLAIARERLTQLTGIQNFVIEGVKNEILLFPSVGSPEDAATLAVQSDPAVGAAIQAEEAARRAIEREKGSFYPEIDFVFNSQYSDVGFDNLSSPARTTESYSISLRYPLFEGGSGSARVRSARADYYAAQQEVEFAKREANGRARTAWVNLKTNTERIIAARQAVKTAGVNLEAARKAVQVGTARFTDILLALAQHTRAKRDLTEARFNQAAGWLELELALGSDPEILAPNFSRAIHTD